MSRASYTKALDGILRPLGFESRKSEWTRVRGDLEERLNLQKSWIDGSVTVNVWAKDLETEKILKEIECEKVLGIRQFGVRIGDLIDGQDRWWKNDPNGPAELAELVRVYALPWFDRVRSLEDQADHWYGRRATAAPWRMPNLTVLAVTLYRLGAIDEALALFEAPVPKTAIESLVIEGRCVQRWLQSRANALPERP